MSNAANVWTTGEALTDGAWFAGHKLAAGRVHTRPGYLLVARSSLPGRPWIRWYRWDGAWKGGCAYKTLKAAKIGG